MNSPPGYWTLERIQKEARKFDTLKEFREKAHKAYDAARSKGFLPKVKEILIETNKPKGFWARARIEEEAKKYEFRSAFHKACPTGYSIASKNGYLDEICSHMIMKVRPQKWTYDRAKETALQYTSRSELRKNEGFCYAKILKEGWVELLSHMEIKAKPAGYWTEDRILKAARKYKTVQEFRHNEPGAYGAAHANKLMEKVWVDKDVIGHKYRRALYVWEFEDHSAYIGLTYNYDKRHRDHKKQGPVHEKSKTTNGKFIKLNKWYSAKESKIQEEELIQQYEKRGWQILNTGKAGSLGGGNRQWTKEKVLAVARRYQTLKEFRSNENGAYIAMQTYHWEEDIDRLYGRVPRRRWTRSEVMDEARLSRSYSEFINNHNKAYVFALRNGLLDEVKALFPADNILEEIAERAVKAGLKLQSKEYMGSQGDLVFQCENGHTFVRSAAVIRRTQNCPICTGYRTQEFYDKKLNNMDE